MRRCCSSPGISYGSQGKGFFRIALTVPDARLKEVLVRMEKEGVTFFTALAKTSASIG
jgi:bifunctional pyridoxal-dependent enzyme with beta-cystathionase and maltose regulon repressor activities